jgi:hypothetical protein
MPGWRTYRIYVLRTCNFFRLSSSHPYLIQTACNGWPDQSPPANNDAVVKKTDVDDARAFKTQANSDVITVGDYFMALGASGAAVLRPNSE